MCRILSVFIWASSLFQMQMQAWTHPYNKTDKVPGQCTLYLSRHRHRHRQSNRQSSSIIRADHSIFLL